MKKDALKTYFSVKIISLLSLFLFVLFGSNSVMSQIYYHDFGTTTITTHPYTVVPSVLNGNLSNSTWSNAVGTWTNTPGNTGESIRLTTNAPTTITLTFEVATNYQVEITSFDFWRVRSNFGPQNWSMTVNGIPAGNGTVPANTGAMIGNTIVANPISGLTGTITVVLSLTGETGNGTFRLDDFTLFGSVTSTCAAPTITSFFPTSGPENTLVSITGSGFLAGGGSTSVKFDGIEANGFSVISDTLIEAYLPQGPLSGSISITTNGCEGFSATNFTSIHSSSPVLLSNDIYISEIYDAQVGSGGVIEIYNGTSNTINLANYSIRRYGDVGDATPTYTLNLVGSIPPGGIFLIGVGTTAIPCTGLVFDQFLPSGGFNFNDEFELVNNTTVIDNAHILLTAVGYSLIRNPNVIAPQSEFDSNDWTISGTESCAGLGSHDPGQIVFPALTQPVSVTACENSSVTFSATLSNSTGFTFQWKILDNLGNWNNISNGGVFSGAGSSTLTINPAPLSFNDSQFYCEITSANGTIISHAAQLEITSALVTPDFQTTLTLCSGDTAPTLNTTSPNGIVGTWSPSTINNTTSGNYVFTPNPNQCALPVTLAVTITNSITPDFATTLTLCSGNAAPTLNTTSPNGIVGTWSPSTINNTTSGNYVFTPNPNQCASSVTLAVTITNSITPDFATTLTLCSGDTAPTLNTTSPNGIVGTWSPTTINNTANGNYVFTPNPNQCALPVTLAVTITNSITPDFATTLTLCSGDTAPTLNTTSPNGIVGTWSPSAINNTASGNYVFTPNPNQCALPVTLAVTITNSITPDFATTLTLCSGDTAPTLNTTSPNGIVGTWSPSAINNTASGNYVFTPNPNQCASSVTLAVTITNSITPDFATTLTLCSGDTAPTLNTTSPNGIVGTWSPSTINNTTSGNYVFTPNPNQCASSVTLAVTITNSITPDFATTLTLCSGNAAPTLNTTSPNGIVGTWSPSSINNTANGNYVFTPNPNQCASPVTLAVTITNSITPDFATTLTLCSGDTAPTLNTTSPNGIVGTWSPSSINNTASGNYVFTPNPNQCALPVTLAVTITNSITPDFATTLTLCSGNATPTLNTTSPNGIVGTWSPSTINNTTSGNYVFTPNPNQCASSVTLAVTITNSITPDFATTLTLCSGNSAPTLNTTSPNGIVGTWSPSTINNTTSGNYVFTPNPNQCALSVTLAVTITNSITPDFATTLTLCSGDTAPTLNTTSPNGIVGTWSPSSINNTANGNYVFTPNPNQCASSVTLAVTITNSITPDFATTLTLCSGDTAPTLNTTSPNGIVGTWSPSTINNTASGNYVFTPNPNQCALPVTLVVTITNSITPDFATTLTLCSGNAAPTLNTTSPNGIVGTWSPSSINNTASGNYVFTPNPNQCASSVTLVVTITNSITPNFATTLTLCSGDTAPTLNTTSPNGIVGTWSPSSINNTASGNYVFTPNPNQCALPVTLAVTVTNSITPDFATTLTLCSGDTAPTLNTTSPNGIVGTWSPSTINNTTSGNYVFTPNPNQCALPVTLAVTITNSITPDFATTLTLCSGDTAPTLNTTSPNGIVGSWSPSSINNTTSGNYLFTPNPNQCASSVTLAVTVTNSITPDFATTLTLCSGDTAPTLNTTSPNGIVGTWSPSTINNTTSGNYVFTPNPNQCASSVTLAVTITNSITPDFATTLTLCSGDTAPTLNTTSPNGIVGTWSPSTINNTTSGNYVFTPNPNQCALPVTLAVTITNSITPDFATTLTLCSGNAAPTLNTTSPNGIVGTWSPSTINNTASGNYVFTPNPNQCALPITLAVTVNTIAVSITGVDALCVGQTTLWTSSVTGGIWSSSDTTIATIDNNGIITAVGSGTTTITYFIQGSCDTTVSETIEVINLPTPILTDKYVCVDNLTGVILAPVLLESGLSNTNYTFVWTLDGDVLPTTQNNHLATETGLYTVTATHTITGCSGSTSATVTASSIAIASATVGQDFDQNQVITVTVTGGSGDYVYILNNGPIQSSNYFTNVLQGENVIIVRDKNGCGELVLTVYSLNYPHFFTPNGDGFNDTWNIRGLENQPTSLIYIFDRYGKLLKTLKASGGNGWDGTYNGENMPSTDYWFTLFYTHSDGFEKEFKAHFSLKR